LEGTKLSYQLPAKTFYWLMTDDMNIEMATHPHRFKTGDVYIILDDRHLVNVILQSKKQKLKIKRDFGIISYNETPLKTVVENGITTISTDFSLMGKTLAEMLLHSTNQKIENPSDIIFRNSL
jgi:DNA-binding LacI/PurR family transcriptional regulator